MHAQDMTSVGSVLQVLDSETAKLPAGSPLEEMFTDWASLLRGEPIPWQVPWDVDALVH